VPPAVIVAGLAWGSALRFCMPPFHDIVEAANDDENAKQCGKDCDLKLQRSIVFSDCGLANSESADIRMDYFSTFV